MTYIEEQEGRTIKEIFADDGEDYFRKLERVYLQELIKIENTSYFSRWRYALFL